MHWEKVSHHKLLIDLRGVANFASVLSLAYAEMRLILAKVIWNFSIRLDPSSNHWLQENKAFILWDKPELNVYLEPRRLDTDRHTSVNAVLTP